MQASELPFLSQWQNFYMIMGTAVWQPLSSRSYLLSRVGPGMLFYSIIVLQRMRHVPNHQSTLEDWLWYLALPLLAYVLLIVAASVPRQCSHDASPAARHPKRLGYGDFPGSRTRHSDNKSRDRNSQ